MNCVVTVTSRAHDDVRIWRARDLYVGQNVVTESVRPVWFIRRWSMKSAIKDLSQQGIEKLASVMPNKDDQTALRIAAQSAKPAAPLEPGQSRVLLVYGDADLAIPEIQVHLIEGEPIQTAEFNLDDLTGRASSAADLADFQKARTVFRSLPPEMQTTIANKTGFHILEPEGQGLGA